MRVGDSSSGWSVGGGIAPALVSAPSTIAPVGLVAQTAAVVQQETHHPLVPAAAPAIKQEQSPTAVPGVLSKEHIAAVAKACACMSTPVFLPVTSLPFDANYKAADRVQFTCALRDSVAINSMRAVIHIIFSWYGIGRHVLNDMCRVLSVILTLWPLNKRHEANSFAQRGRMLNERQRGPVVLEHIIRALCRGLSTVAPALIMQALQNRTVEAGTPFSSFVGQMVAGLACALCRACGS